MKKKNTVLAVDPGTEKSGVVVFDFVESCVVKAEEMTNDVLLGLLRLSEDYDFFAIETVEGMGQIVGKSIFETCIWIGRFQEAWESNTGINATRISRGDEKILLCGAKTVKDPETGKRRGVSDAMIRRALIDLFPETGGGKVPQVGTKKKPGPLYGVKGHMWSALAVAVTWAEINRCSSRGRK